MTRLTEWLFGKPRATEGDMVAVLDVGSSKIACFIARADARGQPRVIGIGHQLAVGIRGGIVSDMEAVQRTIGAAVATAEQMAGETIERVIVNVAGPLLLSQTVSMELPLSGREISEADIQRLIAQGQTMVPEDQQGHTLELVHSIPVHYALDGQKGIRDPLGMVGHTLQTQLHLVSAAFGPVRTLITAIARCHLEVDRLVASPYASGLACLVEDEMDLGSIIIDIGAGTSGVGVFFDGHMIHADGVPVGGAHITSDIARGLTTSLNHAERLKTLYGSAILSQMDEREIIDVPQVGEEAPEHANHVPKAHLIRIIQPRLEEIFELIRGRLLEAGVNDVAGRRVVLTGGTSQLPGIRDVAQRVLDKQVRLGRPLRIARPQLGRSTAMRGNHQDHRADHRGDYGRNGHGSAGHAMDNGMLPLEAAAQSPQAQGFTGLAEATSGPAFATTAGLLAVAMQPELAANHGTTETSGNPLLSRLSEWIKQSL